MEALIPHLVTTGPVGVFAAIFLYLYLAKDKELAAERAARISDMTAARDLLMKTQERTLSVAETLRDIMSPPKASRASIHDG